METLPIELELRKLGLKEKEVRVYLAGLQLGPESVQNIAKNAKITRPTAHDIIKILEKKGLFEEIKKGKKKYFVAQSPDKILGILKIQKREIEEREREFIRIIAALESQYSRKKGGIKIYKGKEALKVLNEIFSFTPISEIFVLSSDQNLKNIREREDIYRSIKKRLGKIDVKEICSKKIKTKFLLLDIERKFSLKLNLKGTLILFDKAIFISAKKEKGLLIENEVIITLLKSFFLTFWKLI